MNNILWNTFICHHTATLLKVALCSQCGASLIFCNILFRYIIHGQDFLKNYFKTNSNCYLKMLFIKRMHYYVIALLEVHVPRRRRRLFLAYALPMGKNHYFGFFHIFDSFFNKTKKSVLLHVLLFEVSLFEIKSGVNKRVVNHH